ncbi:MAG: hypothetical protein ACLRQF_14475 [Thomasclavelia ramosa]
MNDNETEALGDGLVMQCVKIYYIEELKHLLMALTFPSILQNEMMAVKKRYN